MNRYSHRVDAFRVLIRCLAPANPDQALAKDIGAGRISWERVVEIASEYWMTLILYRELGEKDLLHLLPPNDRNDLLEYFQAIHDANLARNQGILAHAEQLAGMFNEIDVEPVLLKGVAHLASGLYADPAVRFMYDIDLLVPDERALECWRLLSAAGYRTLAKDREKRPECMPQDWPALHHPDRAAEVEIHFRTEWKHLLGSPSLYTDARPLAWNGGKAWILNPTSRLIFTLGHSYVHDRLGRRADPAFRDLYDAMLLARSLDREIDWRLVMESFARAGEAESLRVAGMMWQRLLSQPTPWTVDPPRLGWLYWQRCLLKVWNPMWLQIEDAVTANVRSVRTALSRTAEGKQARRRFSKPSILLRKLRTAAVLSAGREPRRD